MNEMPKPGRRRFFIFLLTGSLAALVNVAARILLSQVMSFELSVLIAYIIGMITAYILSRSFVFETSGRSVGEELSKFAIVNLIAVLQVWLVTMTLNYYILPALGWAFYRELTAHLIGVASPVFTSYLGHKHFSFARPKRADPNSD